jgi:hypothetical protein
MRGDYSASAAARACRGRIAIFLPQFFGSLPFFPPGDALFARFNGACDDPHRVVRRKGGSAWKPQATGTNARSSSIFW